MPNLSASDRVLAGWLTLWVRPSRLLRSAIVLKASSLLGFHLAMCRRKYRMLFSPNRRRKPGPKGPSAELIHAVVEVKQRNPRWGCPRIAEQIALAFNVQSTKTWAKDPRPSLSAGAELRRAFLADVAGSHERQPLEYGSVPLRVGHVEDPLGPGRHGSIHAPDHSSHPSLTGRANAGYARVTTRRQSGLVSLASSLSRPIPDTGGCLRLKDARLLRYPGQRGQ